MSALSLNKQTLLPDVILSQPFLLPVTVRVKRGLSHEFSVICLPGASERVSSQILEPIHTEPNSMSATKLPFNKPRKKAERKSRKVDKSVDYSSAIAIAIHKEKMRSLWVPSSFHFKTSHVRPVIGFVTQVYVGKYHTELNTLILHSIYTISLPPCLSCLAWAVFLFRQHCLPHRRFLSSAFSLLIYVSLVLYLHTK